MRQAHTQRTLRFPFACMAIAALAACDPAPDLTRETPLAPDVVTANEDGPEGAPEGTCWDHTVSPAVVEQISERIVVTPAEVNPDGTISKLPEYRNENRQVIVTPRKNNWFETPCPEVLTVEFVSSLQRAMAARGLYGGEINGVIDADTRTSVRVLQQQDGLDSDVLSLATARALGLIKVERSSLE